VREVVNAMHSITVIILHAFVAQAFTKEGSLGQVPDTLVDKLVDKLIQQAPHTGLDGTTLGKPGTMSYGTPTMVRASQPLPICPVPPAVSMAQDTLRANRQQLETLAVAAIDANNRGTGMRNVAAMAKSLNSETREALSKVTEDVVVRAEAAKEGYLGLGVVQDVNQADMAGITAPCRFFDPIGFFKAADAKRRGYYREAELKHGRLGMIAALGFFAGETLGPVFGDPNPGPAVQLVGQALPGAPKAFWGAVVVLVSLTELGMINTQKNAGRAPGDFGWDPLNIKPDPQKDPKEWMAIQNKELNNGRLAMLGAAGIIANELVTGQKTFR